ncbi:MAG: hypothetical protein ACNA7J_01125 [Wenzhouxiangella sp.]
MQIEQATANDSQDIVRLFRHYHFALKSMDWFEWKYNANPVGRAQCFKMLHAERIVGAVAILPHRFLWRGREIIGLQTVDGLLGKEIRGRGNFSEVMQFLAMQQPAGVCDESFFLSFPSLPASIRAHESSGWDRLTRFSLSICMLTPRLLLEKAGIGLMRRAMEFPWAAYRKWIMGPKRGPVQVRCWSGENVQFDAFAPFERICGDRSSAFMKWRVKHNPRDNIQLLMIYDRELLAGYAVIKITGCKTKVLELRLRHPRRRHVQALIRYIYTHHHSDAVTFWSLGRSRVNALVRGMGFVRRRLSGHCFVQHLQRAGLPADPDEWDLTYLDSDW